LCVGGGCFVVILDGEKCRKMRWKEGHDDTTTLHDLKKPQKWKWISQISQDENPTESIVETFLSLPNEWQVEEKKWIFHIFEWKTWKIDQENVKKFNPKSLLLCRCLV
jgi:hypothetical protein